MDAPDPKPKRFSELALRLMSAAVLIPVALWFVWSGGWWIAAMCALVGGMMAYEWGQMSGGRPWWLYAAVAATICLILPLTMWKTGLGLLALGIVFALVSSPGNYRNKSVAAFGVFYVTAMAASMYFLREGDWDGRAAALLFMSFVWASDGGAYFVGRAIGGPRLLPSESPNKTWAGAIGAVVSCIVCGVAAAFLMSGSLLAWVLIGAAISVIAQAGDMFESGLKRRFNVKDSGDILPGHGGVLDRLDGLGAVCIVMTLVLLLVPSLAPVLGL